MTEWHGWNRQVNATGEPTGPALHIGPLPGRKSICLYETDGSIIRTLAFFSDEEKAARALDHLDRMMGIQ